MKENAFFLNPSIFINPVKYFVPLFCGEFGDFKKNFVLFFGRPHRPAVLAFLALVLSLYLSSDVEDRSWINIKAMQSPNIIYWLCSRPALLSALSFSLLHQFFHLLCLQGLKLFAIFNNVSGLGLGFGLGLWGDFHRAVLMNPSHMCNAEPNDCRGVFSLMFEGNLVFNQNTSYPISISFFVHYFYLLYLPLWR